MDNKNKSFLRIGLIAVLIIVLILVYINNSKTPNKTQGPNSDKVTNSVSDESPKEDNKVSKDSQGEELSNKPDNVHTYIREEGMTLESRINTPVNYDRISASPNSLLSFIRNLELKEDGSPVLLYDGNKKGNQKAQVAVFTFDVGDRDLQQCADSIMRIYSEYYWSVGEYENIRFHLTNGFLMDYENWRNGKRIKVEGNNVSWVDSASYDDSYESFRKYLTNVMIYAGTLSMDAESTVIDLDDLKVGDMLLKGGSPGHVVLVVDVAKNEKGESCYLLAQGYMPAQEFHVLKNPKKDDCPWYFEEDLTGHIKTPEYGFDESHIKRWNNGFD